MSADPRPMKIRQYVYFAVKSETVPASSVTAHLGVEPDGVMVRGSRRQDPPRPVCHVWQVECRLPGLAVHEQAGRVLDRLRPVADRLRALTAEAEVSAVLQVVRYFDADDGEREGLESMITADGVVLDKLPGQHHLLGWHLSAEDLLFLASVPAALDVDEYG